MATDIKVVKTVFVVDTEDVKKATKDYNNLADSIDKTGKELTDTGRKATEGSQKVKDGVDKSKQSVDKFKSSFDGIGSVIAGAFAIGSVVAFGKSVLDATRNNETFIMSLTAMLKSKEQANILQAQLVELAKATPFSLEEMQQSTRSLIAMGVVSTDISKTLTTLSDVAAGTGNSITELAEKFGRFKTQGRLYQQDVNELTGRGIPVIEEFAKQFGVAENEVKNLIETGKIGFPEVTKALEAMTSEGGKFYQLSAQLAETTTGQISAMGDNWNKTMVSMGQSTTGFVNTTLKGINFVLESFQEMFKTVESEALVIAGQKTGGVADSYKQIFETVSRNAKATNKDIKNALSESSAFWVTETLIKIKEAEKLLKTIEEEASINAGITNLPNMAPNSGPAVTENDLSILATGTLYTTAYTNALAALNLLKSESGIISEQYKAVLKEVENAEGATANAEKARLTKRKSNFKEELEMLEMQRKKAKELDTELKVDKSESLETEELFNKKRTTIYNKYSDILTNKNKAERSQMLSDSADFQQKFTEQELKERQDRIDKALSLDAKYQSDLEAIDKKDFDNLVKSVNDEETVRLAQLQNKLDSELMYYIFKKSNLEKGTKEYKENEKKILEIVKQGKINILEEELKGLELKEAIGTDEVGLKEKIEAKKLELAKTRIANEIDEEKKKDANIRQIAKDSQKIAKDLIDAYFTYQSQLNTAKIAEYQTQKEKELEAVDANENGKAKVYTKAEAQKMAINEKYRQLEANVKRRQFELDKQKALIDIAINTAVGVSKAYAQGGVLGAITGGIVIASGALQTALIQSQPTPKFAKGGQIKGRTHAEGGQIIEAERDEWVINANASREFHPLLKAINEGTFTRKDLSPELSNMMFGQKMSNINLNTDSLAKELRGMPKNHISLDKEGFKTFLYSENLKQESLNNRYLL